MGIRHVSGALSPGNVTRPTGRLENRFRKDAWLTIVVAASSKPVMIPLPMFLIHFHTARGFGAPLKQCRSSASVILNTSLFAVPRTNPGPPRPIARCATMNSIVARSATRSSRGKGVSDDHVTDSSRRAHGGRCAFSSIVMRAKYVGGTPGTPILTGNRVRPRDCSSLAGMSFSASSLERQSRSSDAMASRTDCCSSA